MSDYKETLLNWVHNKYKEQGEGLIHTLVLAGITVKVTDLISKHRLDTKAPTTVIVRFAADLAASLFDKLPFLKQKAEYTMQQWDDEYEDDVNEFFALVNKQKELPEDDRFVPFVISIVFLDNIGEEQLEVFRRTLYAHLAGLDEAIENLSKMLPPPN